MSEDSDRLVNPAASTDESLSENALRPKTLKEFIGQHRVREQIDVLLTAARNRGAAAPGLAPTRHSQPHRAISPQLRGIQSRPQANFPNTLNAQAGKQLGDRAPPIPTSFHPVRYCPCRLRMEGSRDVQRRWGDAIGRFGPPECCRPCEPRRGRAPGPLSLRRASAAQGIGR